MRNHLAHMVLQGAKKYGNRPVFKLINEASDTLENLSWDFLASKTKEVSKALLSLGYSFESKIGIFANNRPEWTMADIGILSVRGIVVPFYGTSNRDQLKYIVDETQMELMFVDDAQQLEKALWLTDKTTLKTIVSFTEVTEKIDSVISWDDFCKLGLEDDDHLISTALETAHEEDIASIIYTSGTTGEPKGAMLSHLNFMHAFKINDLRLDITENDHSLAFLPLSHIFERSWTFFMMYRGGTNTFLSNPKKVIETLPLVKPTVMCVVPRFFEKTYEGIFEEYHRWSSVKQKIFDWSIAIGHQTIGKHKLPFLLSVKHRIAQKLVLQKLMGIFGGQLRTTPCAGAAIQPELLKFFHAIGLFVNYGYGATETTATVSCMKTNVYDLETCGSIMPETKVSIGKDDEIIVEGDTVFKGYYKKPAETAKVLEGKSYKTGDKGFITKDNYLVMTDRIKDMMKTSGGKYISPQKLELLFGQNKYVEQIVVVGDNKKFVSALIIPSFELLQQAHPHLSLKSKSNREIVDHPEIVKFYKILIDQDQRNLDGYEQIKRFVLLPEPWSIENNGLTNTLKIKRKHVTALYKDLIDEMYQS